LFAIAIESFLALANVGTHALVVATSVLVARARQTRIDLLAFLAVTLEARATSASVRARPSLSTYSLCVARTGRQRAVVNLDTPQPVARVARLALAFEGARTCLGAGGHVIAGAREAHVDLRTSAPVTSVAGFAEAAMRIWTGERTHGIRGARVSFTGVDRQAFRAVGGQLIVVVANALVPVRSSLVTSGALGTWVALARVDFKTRSAIAFITCLTRTFEQARTGMRAQRMLVARTTDFVMLEFTHVQLLALLAVAHVILVAVASISSGSRLFACGVTITRMTDGASVDFLADYAVS
jgi:hypothetical protein